MKAYCAFVLGVSLTQLVNSVALRQFSHLVKPEEIKLLSLQLKLQGNEVGSCRDVRVAVTDLGDDKTVVLMKGRDWTGDAFAKAQPLISGTTGPRYVLASRATGDTTWLYRIPVKMWRPRCRRLRPHATRDLRAAVRRRRALDRLEDPVGAQPVRAVELEAPLKPLLN